MLQKEEELCKTQIIKTFCLCIFKSIIVGLKSYSIFVRVFLNSYKYCFVGVIYAFLLFKTLNKNFEPSQIICIGTLLSFKKYANKKISNT